jgi:hypothetical protein
MSRKTKQLLNKPINQLTETERKEFEKLLDNLNYRGLSQQKIDRIQK